ncbi:MULTISPECIES: hypothetical protein [Serratia]|uniref:hypothetical protein n=1 Tax=Serratia TaxID=613 RepID=UPI0012E11FEE|nr:hypothetical protein [Serratia oryzae]
MSVSDIVFYIVLAFGGVGGLHWGITALRTGEFHGRYRFTSTKYCYRRGDEPLKYWSETLTVLIGGILLLILDTWFIFR